MAQHNIWTLNIFRSPSALIVNCICFRLTKMAVFVYPFRTINSFLNQHEGRWNQVKNVYQILNKLKFLCVLHTNPPLLFLNWNFFTPDWISEKKVCRIPNAQCLFFVSPLWVVRYLIRERKRKQKWMLSQRKMYIPI